MSTGLAWFSASMVELELFWISIPLLPSGVRHVRLRKESDLRSKSEFGDAKPVMTYVIDIMTYVIFIYLSNTLNQMVNTC
jgi:hypothetical protein